MRMPKCLMFPTFPNALDQPVLLSETWKGVLQFLHVVLDVGVYNAVVRTIV